jgi:hypothetical protein
MMCVLPEYVLGYQPDEDPMGSKHVAENHYSIQLGFDALAVDFFFIFQHNGTHHKKNIAVGHLTMSGQLRLLVTQSDLSSIYNAILLFYMVLLHFRLVRHMLLPDVIMSCI